jgi:hypothetical protein
VTIQRSHATTTDSLTVLQALLIMALTIVKQQKNSMVEHEKQKMENS